ncbi:hypothetical protein C8R44DRAFT_747902 [Mycena epipterygia]|nr:hypothetical protein C8R44DRAFT_747902 [Mycena epipterygia]
MSQGLNGQGTRAQFQAGRKYFKKAQICAKNSKDARMRREDKDLFCEFAEFEAGGRALKTRCRKCKTRNLLVLRSVSQSPQYTVEPASPTIPAHSMAPKKATGAATRKPKNKNKPQKKSTDLELDGGRAPTPPPAPTQSTGPEIDGGRVPTPPGPELDGGRAPTPPGPELDGGRAPTTGPELEGGRASTRHARISRSNPSPIRLPTQTPPSSVRPPPQPVAVPGLDLAQRRPAPRPLRLQPGAAEANLDVFRRGSHTYSAPPNDAPRRGLHSVPLEDASGDSDSTMPDAPARRSLQPEYNFSDHDELDYLELELDDQLAPPPQDHPSQPPRRHSSNGRRADHDGTHSPSPRNPRPHSADGRDSPLRAPPAPPTPDGERAAAPSSRRRSPTPRKTPARNPPPCVPPPSPSPGRELAPPPSPCGRSPTSIRNKLRSHSSQGSLLAAPSPPSSELSTDDEWGKQELLKEKAKAKKLSKGYNVPPGSQSEDEEETREFEDAVARGQLDDSDAPPPKRKRSSPSSKVKAKAKAPAKAKAKGKEKEKEKEVEAEGSDGGDEGAATDTASATQKGQAKAKRGSRKGKGKEVDDDEDDDDREEYSHGPVSKEMRDRLYALQQKFNDDVAALALECNKPTTTLHRILGTARSSSRAPIPRNIFEMKWAVDVPFKTSGLTRSEYIKRARAAFTEACGDVDTADSEAVFAKLPELRQWHKTTLEQAGLNWRDDGKLKGKVQSALKPLIEEGQHIYNNFGVHVWGLCIDPQGEASFAFGSTEEFKILREQRKLPLNQTIKDWETLFRQLLLDQTESTTRAVMLPGEMAKKETEGSCDHFRRLFGAIMLAQLTQYCPERPTTMAWNEKFLDLAFVNKFRLINYANALEQTGQIIGGAFELKKIKVHTFQEFMPALERANTVADEEHDDEGVMMIVPWSAHEIRQPLKEQYYFPLVKNVAGDCLRKVHQSEAFILAMAKEKNSNAKGKTRAKREEDYVEPERRTKRRKVEFGATDSLYPVRFKYPGSRIFYVKDWKQVNKSSHADMRLLFAMPGQQDFGSLDAGWAPVFAHKDDVEVYREEIHREAWEACFVCTKRRDAFEHVTGATTRSKGHMEAERKSRWFISYAVTEQLMTPPYCSVMRCLHTHHIWDIPPGFWRIWDVPPGFRRIWDVPPGFRRIWDVPPGFRQIWDVPCSAFNKVVQ